MEYWVWLRTIKGLGPVIEKRLLSVFDSPKEIYNACEEELKSVYGIGNSTANAIISARSLEKAYSILNDCDKNNIKTLTYNDPRYPNIAKEYDNSPILLYYRGNIKENYEGVAIVGSRRCSDYGKEIAIRAAEFLAKNNITVISGMAKGIDGYAHTSCINNGGYTIGFTGSGVDICYPAEHRELMNGIIDNGAVISEFPPGTRPRAEYFPMRNRLISSWSKKILVAEASQNSGALITANIAKAQGKEIYAPPNQIFSSTGKGTNRLLLEGATIYLQPSQLLIESGSPNGTEADIADSVASAGKQRKKPAFKLSSIEKKIIKCISNTAKPIELISSETEIDQIELLLHLSEMELEGKISALPAGKYQGIRIS